MIECSVPNKTFYTILYKGQGTLWKRGQKECNIQRNDFFWTWHSQCSHDLTLAAVALPRSVEDWASQHPIMG